jgi:hypothetical protein
VAVLSGTSASGTWDTIASSHFITPPHHNLFYTHTHTATSMRAPKWVLPSGTSQVEPLLLHRGSPIVPPPCVSLSFHHYPSILFIFSSLRLLGYPIGGLFMYPCVLLLCRGVGGGTKWHPLKPEPTHAHSDRLAILQRKNRLPAVAHCQFTASGPFNSA